MYREEGLPNLTWQSDDYSDDVPFWIPYPGGNKDQGLLILPYSVSYTGTWIKGMGLVGSTTTTTSSFREAAAGPLPVHSTST